MEDYLIFKQNGEIEQVSAKSIEELFDKELMYSLVTVDIPLGVFHLYVDDEGLLKEETEVNYNASFLGNCNGIVGDVIVAGATAWGESTGLEDCGRVIRYVDYLKDRFKDLKIDKPKLEPFSVEEYNI